MLDTEKKFIYDQSRVQIQLFIDSQGNMLSANNSLL